MVWIDSIEELAFYTEEPPCWCELLLRPEDLLLQGNLGSSVDTSDLAFYAEALTTDGLTVLGDITLFCSYFFAYGPDGSVFFNIRLNTIPPFLCANPCFIVRVVIHSHGEPIWDKYTQQYCLDECCVTARDITIRQEGVSYRDIRDAPPISVPLPDKAKEGCRKQLITIKTVFDCYDELTGDFYGVPADTIKSNAPAFPFFKITHIEATYRRLPRSIERTISQNCRLQKSASTRQYELQSFEQFPYWKMDEMETMFHANHIFIDGVEYQMQTATPFRHLYKCKEKYALRVTFEDCPQQQIFGCAENCEEQKYYFRIPGPAMRYIDEMGRSYSDAGLLLRNLNGVVDVEEVTEDMPFPSHRTYAVTSKRGLPPFYADKRSPANKIYPVRLSATNPDLEKIYPTSKRTLAPAIGVITVTDDATARPVIGTVTVTDVLPTDGVISGYDAWVKDSGVIEAYESYVLFSLAVSNDKYPSSGPGDLPKLGERIASISTNMRPRLDRFLTDANDPQIPAECTLVIGADGFISWYGEPTSADSGRSYIELTNITYQL